MTQKNNFRTSLNWSEINRGKVWGWLIIGALLAFEIFNYSTTDFAMTDLLGDLRFVGVRWATILALAFCGIDFAGIARLFSPEQRGEEPTEVWYLFGAWLLAATMNAMLTWWGISIAIVSHVSLGSAVIPRETLLKGVPIFVALIVWLIRILIIGTFSVSGGQLFRQSESDNLPARNKPMPRPAGLTARPLASKGAGAAFRPAPKRTIAAEPTYHAVSMQSNTNGSQHIRR
ncbi:MAG: hypothetical protein OEZ02_10930 [Anaerolineae bacterium]|nr:hypothetical protein [Anaerolineae bacterium]